MPRSLAFTIASALFAVSLSTSLLMAQEPPPGSVWEGAYTDVQATRGISEFSANCAECHTLGSTGDGQLVGTNFWEGYSQKTVGDLLTFVRTNMPIGAEGSLSPAAAADLVALILKSNGLPPGGTDLGPLTGHLKILPKDGSSVLPANSLARVVGCLSKSGSGWVLTSATSPERINAAGVGPEDATKPLGTGTIALKFVLTRLDSFAGQRMSASGILLGAGGVDGLNVSSVTRVAQTCP